MKRKRIDQKTRRTEDQKNRIRGKRTSNMERERDMGGVGGRGVWIKVRSVRSSCVWPGGR